MTEIIDIHVDVTSAVAFFNDLQQRQLPFALSLALNRTAEDGQAAVRRHLTEAFTLRRKAFIERTIKIETRDRASKTKLFVDVGVDPTRDFLAKFELGGLKTPRSGKSLAVPIDVKRNKADVVAKPYRLKALGLHKVTTHKGKVRIIGEQRTFIAGGAVLQRVGRKGQVRVLYALKPSVPIKPTLQFVDTMTRTVTQRWQPNFEGSFAFAVKTAR